MKNYTLNTPFWGCCRIGKCAILSLSFDLKQLERGSALNQDRRRYRSDVPFRYRIRIEGSLDKRWSDCLCGMAISSRSRAGEQVVTTLTGELIDMAALMGVLNTVYDLGFTLLKVERLAD
jgi:hypothetical protein